MKMFKTYFLSVLVIGLLAFAVGCAITDYRGYNAHQTQSESKLWGSDSAVISGDPQTDGTYSYTVKYDFKNGDATGFKQGIEIMTYRNPVFGAFRRDGCVDADGDNIQGRAGSLGSACAPAVPAGSYKNAYWFSDHADGCQFFANLKQAWQPGPSVAVCFNGPQEEVDADLDLQRPPQNASLTSGAAILDRFSSLDDLMGKLWAGATAQSFTASVTAVSFDGRQYTMANPLTISLARNDMRPINWTVDLTSPAGKELLQAVLNNTTDRVPTGLALTFDGGMSVRAPVALNVAFDHKSISNLLAR